MKRIHVLDHSEIYISESSYLFINYRQSEFYYYYTIYYNISKIYYFKFIQIIIKNVFDQKLSNMIRFPQIFDLVFLDDK